MLLAGRFVVGLGIGGASMRTPLYLAEIAPARERGALVSFSQIAFTVGILVVYLVGYAFAADGAWRWMLGLGARPGVVLAIGMLLLRTALHRPLISTTGDYIDGKCYKCSR